MLGLNDLFRKVNLANKGQTITLPLALYTWAADPETAEELQGYLQPCGLSLENTKQALQPFLAHPTPQDGALLNEALSSGEAGGLTRASSLLKVLCRYPFYRITKALVNKGLDLICLKIRLGETRPEETVLEKVVGRTETRVPELARYARCLTGLARNGSYEALYPRQDKLQQLILVLLQTRKGNAAITGPAGAGKTALVEQLARLVVEKAVPEVLKDIEIYELSLSGLLAGTIYRGQFEERLEKILTEVKNNPFIVLFIDEMHLLWGAGRTSESAMDALNILKPALARGEIRLIGATTTEEYHKYISTDQALARRFDEVHLDPPAGDLLLKIVEKAAGAISQKTGIPIPLTRIQNSILLTETWLPNRFQPDKAISLLDEAAARLRLDRLPEISEGLLLSLLAEKTRLPIGPGDKSVDHLAKLEERINQHIIGQREAVKKVVLTLIYRQQLAHVENERNLGTFLFSGPSGSGKTELGRVLAAEFYGSRERLLHIDLSEYTHGADISRLIGASPGLIGYDSPGLLESFLHEKGSGVLLFDEIEKADPLVWNFLLGILDNGRVRSAKGELLSTRGSIIILTSNVLKEEDLTSRGTGVRPYPEKSSVEKILGKTFPPEFLNRFDELVLFHQLSEQDIRDILYLRLSEELERFALRNIQIEFDREELINYLLSKIKKNDARSIQRVIEKYFSQPAACASLSGNKVRWEAEIS